jgi:hypothetical protein
MQARKARLGEDLGCSLARAWQELGTDRHALFTSRSSIPDVRGFPPSSRATTFLSSFRGERWPLSREGRHLPEDFSRISEQVTGIEAKRLCYLTLCP